MARTELPNGVILPAEHSDDWYEDMTSNLTKLDDVIGSDSEKLKADGVDFLRMSSAALTDGGTGNFSDLNSSYKIKTGDLILDSGRKLYQVVSVDSTNEKFTVGNSLFKITAESDLAPVAESGDYDDLDNKPDLKPVATSGDYDDLDNKPDLNPVATSGDYDDLTDLPTYGITRYCSSAITDNSSIAFSAISSTNKIKVGDFLLDINGKMYQISAVDTTNQTVTVGSALIDLALDGNVVHTNRNDDVSIPLNSTSAELGVTGGYTDVTFLDKNNKKLSGLTFGNYASSKLSYVRLHIFDKDASDNEIQDILEYSYVSNNANAYLRVYRDNFCTLGSSSCRWKSVYATNYYYGSNNVEFSTKFVTTDTNQTVSGNKTFNGNTNCVGELNQTAPFQMTSDTSFVTGTKNTRIYDQNGYQCANETILYNNNKNIRRTWNLYNNSSGATVSAGFNFILSASGQKVFYPISDNDTDNGSSSAYWKNTYTKLVNGTAPSGLSMPTDNLSNIIDISGYITVLDGSSANTYQAPDNGYISITMNNCSGIQAYITGFWGNQIVSPTAGVLRFFMPVCKNMTVNILVYGGTIDNARFFPCQGNI